MAEELYLQKLATQLIELVQKNHINSVQQNGKTFIEQDSILTFLKRSHSANYEKSDQTNSKSDKNRPTVKFKEDLKEEKEDIYDNKKKYQPLKITKTIRFIDCPNNDDDNDTFIDCEIQRQTNTNHGIHNDEIDANIPSIDWRKYGLSHLKDEEEEKLQYYSNKELFIVLSDYVLIYSKPGDKFGVARNLKDSNELCVIYILNKYELVLIESKQRDYTSECYVKCLLPVRGWIYLPQSSINEWIAGIHTHHRIDMQYIYKIKTQNDMHMAIDSNDNNEIWKQLEENNIDRLTFLNQQIAPLLHPLAQNTVETVQNAQNADLEISASIQPQQEEEQEQEEEVKGIKKCLNCLVSFMRAHPFFPGLAITLIQAGIEVVIFFDIITDIMVVYQLSQITNDLLISLFFTLSVVFLISPYMIGWVSTTQWMFRKLSDIKLKQESQSIVMLIIFVLFNIAPIGVFTLLIGDIIHVAEYVIVRPIAYLFELSPCLNCNNKCYRLISFEELGYWKLRRVSEIFAETIPQSVLQLLLLLLISRASDALNLNIFTVIAALTSSVIVTLFWISILLFESQHNGMNFVEYVCVVFQGSFKFVPFLPAIERGKKNGIDVNWTRYSLDVDGLGLVAKALHNKQCGMKTLKISLYTMANLHRNACKYFGKIVCESELELIISRQESEIKHLFHVYDIDDNWYFDFEEFARCCLVMRKDVKKSVNLYTVSSLFWSLTNNQNGEIYLLDLLLKMGSSKTRIPLLDFDNTLHFATKHCHINLISLLMATKYEKYNYNEFEFCVIDSVLGGKEKCAMALCEERGIPIVIELISATLNKTYNPFVVISIGDIEIKSKILYNKSNPFWHNDSKLLFIVPFNQIDEIMSDMTMMTVDNMNKSEAQTPMGEEPELSGSNYSDNVLDAAEKAIDALSELDNKEYQKMSPRESAILKEIEFLSRHEMNEKEEDELYERRIKRKDIKIQIEINKSMRRVHRNTMEGSVSKSNDAYNATLRAINYATMRRNSLSSRSLPDCVNSPSSHKHHFQKQRLMVNVKMNHSKIQSEDNEQDQEEFIGGFKLKIDVSGNIMRFHENVISQPLQIGNPNKNKKKQKFIISGKLEMRIYLNVLQKYNKHGLKYIDLI